MFHVDFKTKFVFPNWFAPWEINKDRLGVMQ